MQIKFEDVNFNYTSQTNTLIRVLKDINFEVNCGEFVSIIGHTGSGKTTLVQNINALEIPNSGKILVEDYLISNEKLKNIYDLRIKIGMVFQFAENQLFEETVLKDVMFGPLNFGFDRELAKQKAIECLKLVGLDASLYEKSPHELSGGQMRRVAIAGVLAYEPHILILDEPTAGLDPIGQVQMMELFKQLNDLGKTILMISHNFNHVLNYTKRIVMLENGQIVYDGESLAFFNSDIIDEDIIELPDVLRLANGLRANGLDVWAFSYDELINKVVDSYGK